MTQSLNILKTARELEAIAQTGLHFTRDPYDKERYARLRVIAAELMESISNLTAPEILEWCKSDFGYATPKVDVRAFVVREEKVLLIRENQDAGRWTLPGGWADVNESPSESIIREVAEESGYFVKTHRLLAVLDREKQGHSPSFPYHIYKLFFHCSIIGGSPRPNLESSECRFFHIDALPELSTTRVLETQIKRFYRKCATGKHFLTEYD
jgi:ADP-ribose pyrophosphatase YjhB (NUDIX family)